MRLLQYDDLRWVTGGTCSHGLTTSGEYFDNTEDFRAAEEAMNNASAALFDVDPNNVEAYAAAQQAYDDASNWYSSASSSGGYMEVCTDNLCNPNGGYAGQGGGYGGSYGSTYGGGGNGGGGTAPPSGVDRSGGCSGSSGSGQYDANGNYYYQDSDGTWVLSGAHYENGEWTVDDVVVTATRNNDSGWYLNFGLGLGAGFNLSFSRHGVQASVGAGVWGTFQVGHAPTAADFREATRHNLVFAGATVQEIGVGVSYDYRRDEWDNTVGVVLIEVNPNDVDVSLYGVNVENVRDFTLGFDAGFGWKMHLGGSSGGWGTQTPPR